MKKKHWGGLNFTADTNCAIDWQSEFDMPGCPGSPNTSMYPGDPTKKNTAKIINSDSTPATSVPPAPAPKSKMPSWGWWLLGALAATGIILAMKKK